MNTAAIVGVVIGVLLCATIIGLVIYWCVHRRRRGLGQGHVKMLDHGVDPKHNGSSHHQPTPSSWDQTVNNHHSYDPVIYPNWIGSTTQPPVQPQSQYPPVYPTGPVFPTNQIQPENGIWAVSGELPIQPIQAPSLMASNPAHGPEGYGMGLDGDSRFDMGNSRPRFDSYSNDPDNLTQSNSKNALHYVRSKLRTAALLSQLNAFNLRHNRRLNSLTTPTNTASVSKIKRTKIRHMSHKEFGSSKEKPIPEESVQSNMPTEGYYNMNIMSDCFEHDEMPTLDNDQYLRSLEMAVFDGLSTTQQQYLFVHPQYPVSCLHTYPVFPNPMDVDLGIGFEATLAHAPPDLDAVTNTNRLENNQRRRPFKFPPPGPPVAGWANRMIHQTKPSIVPVQSIPTSVESPIGTKVTSPQRATLVRLAGSPAIPVIKPPPETARYEKISSAVGNASPMSSNPIPRRRSRMRSLERPQEFPVALNSDPVGHANPTQPLPIQPPAATITFSLSKRNGRSTLHHESTNPIQNETNKSQPGSLPQFHSIDGPGDSGYQDSFAEPSSVEQSLEIRPAIFDTLQSHSGDDEIPYSSLDLQTNLSSTAQLSKDFPLTASMSSSGTGPTSADSTTAMFPTDSANRKYSNPSFPNLCSTRSSSFRSPSYPDLLVPQTEDNFRTQIIPNNWPITESTTNSSAMMTTSTVSDSFGHRSRRKSESQLLTDHQDPV